MRLDDDQQVMVDELIKRYSDNEFNTHQLLPSSTGSGKGIMAGHVLKHFSTLQPLIFCTKNTVTMWESICKQLNLKPLAIMTYNKLTGDKTGQCDHQYLHRTGKEFKTTKKWKNLKGVFIICDESQALKNKTSLRHWAVYTLMENNIRDKLLHLTASPMEKTSHWVPLYRQMGIVKHKIMLKNEKGRTNYQEYGLGDILRQLPEDRLTRFHQRFDMKSRQVPDILAYLWDRFFRQKLVIRVVDPIYKHPTTNKVFNKNIKNIFITLTHQDAHILRDAVNELKKAGVINDEDEVDLAMVKSNFGKVQTTLMQLCRAKLNAVVRLSLDKLTKTNNKVIIACPYVDDQLILIKLFDKYNPLLLNGKTKDRDGTIDLFNQPNN